MADVRPIKIIKVGSSLAIILPAPICRDLGINRGDYFDLAIGGPDIVVIQKIDITRQGEFKVINEDDSVENDHD